VLFTYLAPCVTGCDTIGLTAGALVGGTIGFADAAVAPNGVIGIGSVESFAMVFGNLGFGLGDLGAGLVVVLDATASVGASYFMDGLTAAGLFTIFNDGAASNVFISGPNAQQLALGQPGLLIRNAAAVAEPGSILLLAVGLLMAGWSRRNMAG
jgi:hypothetical protein